MKLDSQKRALESALIEIGYETLMKEGIRLPDAIVRSNPTYSAFGSQQGAIDAAERIMTHQLFGAMAKQVRRDQKLANFKPGEHDLRLMHILRCHFAGISDHKSDGLSQVR